MADKTGHDILLQLLDGQKELQVTLGQLAKRMETRMDALEKRQDNTNGTITLIGRVLNELTVVVKERLERLERHTGL
jgi:hypothetical protein